MNRLVGSIAKSLNDVSMDVSMNVGPQDGALRLASISIGQDIQRQRHQSFICDQRVTSYLF
jgi:hypothetical protein